MIVSEEFYIGYRDIDSKLQIKNSAILNIFEDVAGIHATIAGEGLKEPNLKTTWVLTGYNVKVFKRPEYGDKVKVYTWSSELKNITAAREFEIRNKDNELLVIGLSNWAHINLQTKKIEKVDPKIAEGYQTETEKTNFEASKLKKLQEPEEYLYEKEYTIDWNWIDINNHMNNIYYMELATMVLPDDTKFGNDFSSFEIMYKKEIKYNDKIKCLVAKDEDSYTVVLKSQDLSVVHAIIKLYK